MTPDREAELLAQIETLTDRVIANSEAQADADDLRRENAELRKLLADAPTSEAAVAKLREWSASAGPGYEYGLGATHIAMSVAMARKILDEIDELMGERDRLQRSETALTATIRAYPDAVANSAANLAHARAQRDEMTQRVTELRGEVKELYAKLATANRVIEVADGNCTCMAVIAARATVDNEEAG